MPVGINKLSIVGETKDSIPDSGNLQNNFDAREITGLADGDAVSTWADSESGSDLTQTTASNQPTYKTNVQNSQPVVRFDDSDFMDNANISFNSPFSWYVVVVDAEQPASDNEYIIDAITGDTSILRWNSGSWDIFGTSELDGGSTASPVILSGVFNGASSAIGENGADTTGDVGSPNPDGFTVGANDGGGSQQLLGDIGIILTYTTGHDDATRTEVETYLNNAYSIY